MGAKEPALIAQLSSEFGFELEEVLSLDREPSEEELSEAVGGEAASSLLCTSSCARVLY